MGFHRKLTKAEEEISLEALGSILLRWRRTIIAFWLSGPVCGLASRLLSRRVYETAATFIPQASDVGMSGLALAASRLGLNVPTNTSAWGPPVYVELLHSAALLGPLVVDTVEVREEGGRRAVLMDLLEVPDLPPARRAERAVTKLRKVTGAVEDKWLGAVRLTVTTRWPSLSLLLAQRLVDGVTRFNLETRKSQAGAERQFEEGQAAEAERALREAEERLQSSLQQNRALRGGARRETDGREGLRSLELLIGMYLSARDGKPVGLPLEL